MTKRDRIGRVAAPKVDVPRGWRGWSWNILPQEGQVHLAIYRVTMGDKSFLAYSGIGTANLTKATRLTQLALEMMTALISQKKDIWLDTRQREETEWRVVSAFHGAKNGGMVLFISQADALAGSVNAMIQEGDYREADA
jgi:hypothetical protein